MSLIKTGLVLSFAWSLIMTGCDNDRGSDKDFSGKTVSLKVDMSTRNVGTDSVINSLRILAFLRANESLTFNDRVNLGVLPLRIKLKSGKYDLYMVANEPSSLSTSLENISTPQQLLSLPVSKSILLGVNGQDSTYLMSGLIEDVEVTPQGKVRVAGGVELDALPFNVRRVASKFTIRFQSERETRVTRVRINNLPPSVPLYEGMPTATLGDSVVSSDIVFDANPFPTRIRWEAIVQNIVVPPTFFSPANDALKGITLSVTLDNGVTLTTPVLSVSGGVGVDYTLGRNIHYSLVAVIRRVDFFVSLNALPWDEEVIIDFMVPFE